LAVLVQYVNYIVQLDRISQMIIAMGKGEEGMDILDAIRVRKSIRGYKTDQVPQAVIREILEIAGRAPSAMNTQPWEFAVVTGEPLRKIREESAKKLNAGEIPQPEHHVVGWTNDSIYRMRQVDLAKHIFQIMNIPREDKGKRAAWLERGFRYFDAPAAIIIFVDKTLSENSPLLDVGAVMQNICLAALHFGLGTCIHDQGVVYPDVVRRYAGVPEAKRLIIAISLGYPDKENIANTITSTREAVDDFTNWVGFS
jgi:nitroreductase